MTATITITIPVTEATPAQIDAQIARINGEIAEQERKIARASNSIERSKASRYYDEQNDAAAIARLWAIIGHANEEIAPLAAEVAPLNAEFDRRGGWTRYYLITDGHLHYDISGYRCSRTENSDHYWITTMSGLAAEEAIELAGERVCTLCFPNAPVAVLSRPSQLLTKTEEERAQARKEREEARSAKETKRVANAITAADGGDLRDSIDHKITTVTAAKSEYFQACEQVAYYGDVEEHAKNRPSSYDVAEYEENRVYNLNRYEAVRVQVLAALAAKFDMTPEAYEAQEAKKVAARIRKARKEAAAFRAQHRSLFI